MEVRKAISLIALFLGTCAFVLGTAAIIFSHDHQVEINGLLSVIFGVAYATFGLSLKNSHDPKNTLLMYIAISLLTLFAGLAPILLEGKITVSLFPLIYLVFIGKEISELLHHRVEK